MTVFWILGVALILIVYGLWELKTAPFIDETPCLCPEESPASPDARTPPMSRAVISPSTPPVRADTKPTRTARREMLSLEESGATDPSRSLARGKQRT